MSTAKKLFYIGSGFYILCALTLFTANGFNFVKGVSRHAPFPECANVNSLPLDLSRPLSRCADTDDLRWGDHFTWINWQFLSNNRGHDQARYMPVDLFLLALVNSSVYFVSRKKTS